MITAPHKQRFTADMRKIVQ